MTAPRRRGACPGLSAPMPTGDGLLVRLVPAEPIALDAFAGFCEAAYRHGNGTIEVSARGSLQVRGLTARSAPLFASAVTELGIVAPGGVPVVAGPVVDDADTMVDTAAVATELRHAFEHTRLALSPKVSVLVDGGGRLHVDAIAADIRLRAAEPVSQPRFHVGLGGDGQSATWLGSVAPKDAGEAVLRLLAVIAEHGPTARATDILRAGGSGAFRSALAGLVTPAPAPSRRLPAEMIGIHSVRDGTMALGIGLAFGHSRAEALAALVGVAAVSGARAIRPAPDRTMLLIGVAAAHAADLMAAAEQCGFVAHADDPRRGIVACPGAPACASGAIQARAMASMLIPILTPVMKPGSNGVVVHISGCPKGCAHPAPAALTLVGTSRGCGIIRHGAARTVPDHYVDPANLGAEISRIAATMGEAAHG